MLEGTRKEIACPCLGIRCLTQRFTETSCGCLENGGKTGSVVLLGETSFSISVQLTPSLFDVGQIRLISIGARLHCTVDVFLTFDDAIAIGVVTLEIVFCKPS